MRCVLHVTNLRKNPSLFDTKKSTNRLYKRAIKCLLTDIRPLNINGAQIIISVEFLENMFKTK